MAKNKYGYKQPLLRKKPIIITTVSAIAVFGGVLGVIAYKTNADNKIAALKYAFNQDYPRTFNSYEIIDAENDYDKDNLTNAIELSLSTNGSVADTDSDGIIDGFEERYGTDPLNPDTDKDGLADGVEIIAKLSPTSDKTNGKPDADVRVSNRINFDEGYLDISGSVNVYSANVEKLSLYSVEANVGAYSAPYEFYCKSEFDEANITFSYSPGLLTAAGLKADDLHIYKFNPRTKQFTDIGGTHDTENNTVSCKITENGVYLIGADHIIHTVIDENTNINIHLLIDNSGSMYASNANYKSEENDVFFKRLSFANNLVSKLSANTDVAITAFTFSFNTLCDFTNNKADITKSINDIRSIGPGYDGTSVERAIMLALKSFGEETKEERNIIIMLTDGISTDTAGYKLDDIVNGANAKNVTVMTISLGDDIDRELLQKIADGTGGNYFPIADANTLEGLYSTIIATMENDIVDENMDGTPDSYSLYDTGFRAEENGFRFLNFKSKDFETMDFGMAALARDWFKGQIITKGGQGNDEVAYDFSSTTLDITQPLSKVLLPSMTSKYVNPDFYLDFLSDGDTLKVKSDVFKEAKELGWVIKTVDYPGNSDKWKKIEYLVPNYAMGKIRVKYGENDNALLRAIHYYNTFRDTAEGFVLSDEGDLNKVKKILGSGSPMVMKLTWEENGQYYSRFVNLIALRRDMDNPNLFNLKIYDTNTDPVDTITLNRTMKIDGDGSFHNNYTYSATWDGKQVSVTFYNTEIK